MATAKPTNSLPQRSQPSRRRVRAALFALIVALAALAWFWQPLNARAVTATSYGARVACGCRFIEGRPLARCRDDFMPGMGLVILSEDDAGKSVTARFPLLSSQTATWRPGQGCTPEKWEE